ncbi:hypothetical protein C922_00431 [Plasmodium inui San Antonio 1]|uniref:Uncharacterized protein n=1 Tax=Plasmodium inui San Antonio 1 TaxID=1237626 RepID=W7A8M8_9APIC|nr:hypothetical protein C922_00431 [Plasmodium inui San Antonio 1]EUD69567.1 hypothetical protein C922_00431 [Plasmodium inui San Antonio 1]
MREEYEKVKESIKEIAQKHTAPENLIKRIDTTFEYKIMRSMKARNNDNSAVKEKRVALLLRLLFQVSAIVFFIIGIMLVDYYELKLNKLKKMNRVFEKFNAHHVLP